MREDEKEGKEEIECCIDDDEWEHRLYSIRIGQHPVFRFNRLQSVEMRSTHFFIHTNDAHARLSKVCNTFCNIDRYDCEPGYYSQLLDQHHKFTNLYPHNNNLELRNKDYNLRSMPKASNRYSFDCRRGMSPFLTTC